MFELFSTPRYSRWNIHVHFSEYTGEWNIEGKSYDRGNIKAYNTYGTSRINGYKIIEETLNLRDVRIFDYVEDAEGRKQAARKPPSPKASRSLSKPPLPTGYGKTRRAVSAFAACITTSSIPTARGSMTAAFYPLQVSTPKSRSESIRSTP